MSSRFFHGGDSDSDSSSEEEDLYEQPVDDSAESEDEDDSDEEEDDDDDSSSDDDEGKGASRFLRGDSDSDDSDDEDRERVVKSAKDKRLDELEGTIKLIDNAEKIGDWAVINSGMFVVPQDGFGLTRYRIRQAEPSSCQDYTVRFNTTDLHQEGR
jgi:translation initiation factor 3 subunit C